jgi:integrase
MAKRANGEGNVRQRPNGTWEGRLSYIDPATDKRRSTSVYAATAAECRRELRKVRRRIEGGKPAKDAPDTVASWLAQWRESSLAASDRKATTKSLYGTLSRKHLECTAIGAKRLDKLKPSDVEAVIVELRGKDLADSTVRQVYTVLRQALDVAVRGDGLLASNPAAKVKRPGVARMEARYLPAADVARLLDAARGLRYYVAVVLMAATGLRRGEVCGPMWISTRVS